MENIDKDIERYDPELIKNAEINAAWGKMIKLIAGGVLGVMTLRVIFAPTPAPTPAPVIVNNNIVTPAAQTPAPKICGIISIITGCN